MPVMNALALPVTQTQWVQLQKMTASTTLPHRKVVQAKALLWAAQGLANHEIARRCEVDSDTLWRWRAQVADKGLTGSGYREGTRSQTRLAQGNGGRDRAGHLPRGPR
jgi:hypothetical protein